jgi:senataxin
MIGWGGGGGGGGRGAQREDAGVEWPNLVDVVLSWRLEDVMNEGFFKDKVCKNLLISSISSLRGGACVLCS